MRLVFTHSQRVFRPLWRQVLHRRFGTSTHLANTKATPSLNVKNLEQGRLFDSKPGEECFAEPIRLRLHCTCDKCVDPSDGQKNYSHAYIPEDIDIRDHSTDEQGNYIVRWVNDVPGFGDDHVSTFSPAQIAQTTIKHHQEGRTLFSRPQQLWDRGSFDIEKSMISYDDYMSSSEGLALALHHLWQNGLVFVKDVPPQESSVGQLAERVAPLRNTFYQPTWDVRSKPDAENVAYTSRHLGFHMDLLYMHEPPGLQFLHCIENTCEGGESAFADTFQALFQIEVENTEQIRDLSNVTMDYGYRNGPHSFFDNKPVISYSTDRNKAALKRTKQGRIISPSSHLYAVHRVYWSPPFVKAQTLATRVGREQLQKMQVAQKRFADELEKEETHIETKLPPGTCAIFDNLRVVHARKAFNTNSGHRWLRGAYLDHQDFFSKAQELESLMPSPPPRARKGLRKYKESQAIGRSGNGAVNEAEGEVAGHASQPAKDDS